MIYAMADIHGEYQKYLALLQQIHFCDQDTLYVLGDVVDRGEEPVPLLEDMANRCNVYPILGNHELMAMDILQQLSVEITQDNHATQIDEELMGHIMEWQLNGGTTTASGFQKLPVERRRDLLDYLADFALYETIDVGENTFILTHAGLNNFAQAKALRDYSVTDLTMGRFDYDKQYFDDPSIYIVTGHTPTQHLTGKAEMYINGNNINIDCGAGFAGGRLCCLCLNTLQAFYA